MVKKEAHEDVFELWKQLRQHKGFAMELLHGEKEAHKGSHPTRRRDQQAKPQRYSRLGPANPNARGWSPQQVADLLGLGRDTVDRMIADRILRAVDGSRPGARKRRRRA